ncbi:hypothetical protein BH20ACI4_BH20ACI4_15570 [soil metagenome]
MFGQITEISNLYAAWRKVRAGGGWNLSYAKIIERQVHHLARVIKGEDRQYKSFVFK